VLSNSFAHACNFAPLVSIVSVTIRHGAVDKLLYSDASSKKQIVGVRYDHAPGVHAALIPALNPKVCFSPHVAFTNLVIYML
jgi:hypothetical protein